MAKRPFETGLGRGLDALLGSPEVYQSRENGTVTLPVSQVQPGLNQPRKRFDPAALAELTESIRIHGIIQPLTVRRLASGYYQIIAGERRWRAAKEAGLAEVPAVIIEADDPKVMELGLIENRQREDLNPLEEARGYETLAREYGLTQEEIAKRMGKSRPAITNALRLLTLPDRVLSMVESGTLSAGHAKALLAAPSADAQIQIALLVESKGLSVRQTEELAKRAKAAPKKKKAAPARADLDIYLADAEKTLASRLGRKVRIVQKGKKGRIELEYYDWDDLDALLSVLDGKRGSER